MRRRRIHDKLDIDQYLAEEARRLTVTQEVIDQYKEIHKSRDKPSGKRVRYVYYHGSSPFCKVCNEDLVVGDDVFHFYVSGSIMYHIDCFRNLWKSQQRNIIYQDRAWRKKHGFTE